jgi:hypothetical protein
MSTYRDLLVVVPSPSSPPAPQLATSGGGASAAVPRAWAWAGTAPAVPAAPNTSAAQAASPASRRDRKTFMVLPLNFPGLAGPPMCQDRAAGAPADTGLDQQWNGQWR